MTPVTAARLSLTSGRGQCVPPSDFEASRTSVADVDRGPPARRGGHAPRQRGHVERGSWPPGQGQGQLRVPPRPPDGQHARVRPEGGPAPSPGPPPPPRHPPPPAAPGTPAPAAPP